MWLLPGSRCGLHATYGAPLTFPTAGPTKKRTTATSDGTMFPTIVPRCLCLRRCWLRRQRACRPRAMCHLLADLYLSARFDDRSTRPFRELLCFSCEAAYCCCFDVMVDDNQTGHAIVRAWLEGIRSIHPPPFKKATVFSRRSSSRTSALSGQQRTHVVAPQCRQARGAQGEGAAGVAKKARLVGEAQGLW